MAAGWDLVWFGCGKHEYVGLEGYQTVSVQLLVNSELGNLADSTSGEPERDQTDSRTPVRGL